MKTFNLDTFLKLCSTIRVFLFVENFPSLRKIVEAEINIKSRINGKGPGSNKILICIDFVGFIIIKNISLLK